MSQSVAYYNKHTQAFLDETLPVGMSALYDAFLPHLSENAHILDVKLFNKKLLRLLTTGKWNTKAMWVAGL